MRGRAIVTALNFHAPAPNDLRYRQWVLSFPGPMVVHLGYDAPLLAAIAGRLAIRGSFVIVRRAARSSGSQLECGRGAWTASGAARC